MTIPEGPGVVVETPPPAMFPSPKKPRPIANICANGSCPTIYRSGPTTLMVQGFTVSPAQAGFDVPDGEMIVEIPVELLAEAVRNLS